MAEKLRERITEIIKTETQITCNSPCYLDRQIIRPEDLQIRVYNSIELTNKIITEIKSLIKSKLPKEQLINTTNMTMGYEDGYNQALTEFTKTIDEL